MLFTYIVIYCFWTTESCVLFISNWFWVKVFVDTYISKHEACFYRSFELISQSFLNEKTKEEKETRFKKLSEAKRNDINMMGFPIISCTLPLFKNGRFYWISIPGKRTFKLSSTKKTYGLYKNFATMMVIEGLSWP